MDLIPRTFEFDDLFNSVLTERNNKMFDMKCDIYEEDGVYNLIMDIPGFDKDNVKIECDDGYLTITAEKETKNNDKNYIRQERHYGKIQRSFYVGNIDHESVEAKFKDGTLKIKFPKEDENANKKFIEIK